MTLIKHVRHRNPGQRAEKIPAGIVLESTRAGQTRSTKTATNAYLSFRRGSAVSIRSDLNWLAIRRKTSEHEPMSPLRSRAMHEFSRYETIPRPISRLRRNCYGMESGRRETLSDPACFVSPSRIRALMISEHLAKTRQPNRREDGLRRSPAPDHGAAGCSLPPSRTMATRLASPVASSVSTKRPDRVAAPRAGVRRPLDMPVTRRRKGSSFSIPITE